MVQEAWPTLTKLPLVGRIAGADSAIESLLDEWALDDAPAPGGAVVMTGTQMLSGASGASASAIRLAIAATHSLGGVVPSASAVIRSVASGTQAVAVAGQSAAIAVRASAASTAALASASQSAAGAARVAGAGAQSLAASTSAAQGGIRASAAAATTLAGTTNSVAALLSMIAANFNQPLPGVGHAATGVVPTVAAGAQPLAAVTQAGTATLIEQQGTIVGSQVLAALLQGSSASLGVRAISHCYLGGVSQYGRGGPMPPPPARAIRAILRTPRIR